MLDDQLVGVHKHERQIKEVKEQTMVATYKSDSEEVTLSPQEVRSCMDMYIYAWAVPFCP